MSEKDFAIKNNLIIGKGTANSATIDATSLTTSRTIKLPDIAGTLAINPTTTIGDLVYASATGAPGTLSRLGIGTASQFLIVNSNANGYNWISAPTVMATLTGYTTTATAAGTTTLSSTSSYYQVFTGTNTQTIVLPVTSTLQTGWSFKIVNNSTGNLTVNSSGNNTVITIISGTAATVTCIGTTLTTAADWEAGLTDFSTYTGSGNLVFSNSPTIRSSATGSVVLTTDGLSGQTEDLQRWSVNGSVQARVTSSGNFGINITTPLSLLHVQSSVATDMPIFDRVASSGVGQYNSFRQRATYAGALSDGFGPFISFHLNTTQVSTIGAARDGTDNSGALVFGTTLNGSTFEKMRLTSDGYLWLGTTTQIAAVSKMLILTSGSTVGLSVVGSSQTASLQRWFTDSSTLAASISASGTFSTTNGNIVTTNGYVSAGEVKTDLITPSTGTLSISGNLVVNGLTTTINSNTIAVDDKNIELGSATSGVISSTGTIGTVSGSGPYTATITGMSTTVGLISGQVITATNGTGNFGSGTVTVSSIVSTTSINISSTATFTAGTVTNITGAAASDSTADGGGITLKGTTDKTLIWDSANTNWTSSENLNIASGKVFKINNVQVLSNTALGSGVIGSSLTSVGVISSGTWQGSAVGVLYGGTGQTSYTDGQLLIGNSTGNTLTKATLTGTANQVTVTNGAGSITLSLPSSINVNTTGSSSSLSISGQTGLLTFTGLLSTNRTKTVRDAADTILELGGSYTPTGTWNWTSATATWPTFNQNTNGSAASLSISGQSGLLTFTGITSTNRVKTVRDAADTLLELGGSYTPTGTWNWTSVTATWPTFNQNTTGTASNVTGTVAIANGGTGSTSAPKAIANLMGYTSTATAGTTTTLTNTSSYYQQFTGTLNQTVQLPVTSTLQTGWTFHIVNNSTGTVTVNSSGGNLVISTPAGTTAMVTCIGTTLTTAADWEFGLTDFSTYTGSGNLVLATSPTLITPILGTPQSGNFSTGTFTWPTFNQNTTGTATNATNLTGATQYSIPYQTASSTTGYLNIGTANQVLTVNGTATGYVWSSPLTNPMTTLGDMIYGGASGASTRLANAGTTNGIYILQQTVSAGAAAAPSWLVSTGTGNNVLATSPTFTTSIDGGATFAAFASSTTIHLANTATTINIANTATAAQTLNLGAASTGASTYNIGTGATAASTIKTLNIGTGGAASSTTNINIGSSNGGTLAVNSKTITLGTTISANIPAGNISYINSSLRVNGGSSFDGSSLTTLSKTIQLGVITSETASTTGTVGSIVGSAPNITATISNLNSTNKFIVGMVIGATDGTGSLGAGTVTVTGILSGTSVSVSATSALTAGTITDIFGLGSSSASANNSGINVAGSTSSAGTLYWADPAGYWTSGGGFNIASGKSYTIGGVAVLSNTTLASTVTSASGLATVGTITTGRWRSTTEVIGSAYGGTGNGFTKFSGPATSEKTFVLPNANADVVTSESTFTSWTPVLTAVTTNPTLGTGSTQAGRFIQIGKLIYAFFNISFGTSGVAAGSGGYRVSLPNLTTTITGTSGQSTITVGSATGLMIGMRVIGTGVGASANITAIAGTTVTLSVANSGTVSGTGTFYFNAQTTTALSSQLGSVELYDSSALAFKLAVSQISDATTALLVQESGSVGGVTDAAPWTWAASDIIRGTLIYETTVTKP